MVIIDVDGPPPLVDRPPAWDELGFGYGAWPAHYVPARAAG
jgi:hypothetical protein